MVIGIILPGKPTQACGYSGNNLPGNTLQEVHATGEVVSDPDLERFPER